MMERVTAFATQPTGARSFGLTVRGIHVLVTAEEGCHENGRALAAAIAQLGPEAEPHVQPEPDRSVRKPVSQPRPSLAVGQRVWCTVHGAEGYCTVREVGEGRNRGRIKITGERCWCPAGNFRPEQDAE
jgi:hypothetical protein